ncbi:MAG: hypothetical protein ACYC2O_06175 [Microthrixaceae bacterium]
MAPTPSVELRRPVLLAAVALLSISGVLYACTDDPAGTGDAIAEESAEVRGIRYVAPDAAAFRQAVVINSWIGRDGGPDTDSIDGHAWDLWRAITALSGQELNGTPLPVWETWYSDAEVFLDDQEVDESTSRDLDPLNQSLHAGSLADPERVTTGAATAAVLSFNRFTREVRDVVHQNRFYDRSVLEGLDSDFDLAGVRAGGRTIPQLPNTSVMLKPVWWIVPGDEPSMLPYWAGGEEPASTDPQNPTWKSWRQCVLIDPTRTAEQVAADADELTSSDRTCNSGQPGETSMPGGRYEARAVGVDPAESDFYAFRLTQDEVDGLGQFKMMLDNTNREEELDKVEAGDLAVLVAMHVSTREIADWTWQTFWWSPTPQSPPDLPPSSQSPPRDLTGPWAQFNMCSAYYMTEPRTGGPTAGEDLVCFNPYLETDLTGLFSVDGATDDLVGRTSNCMSCHRAATFHPSEPTQYVAGGELPDDDPRWFDDGVQLEFLWSLAFHAHDGPFRGPSESSPPPTASTTTQAPPTTGSGGT